MVIEKKTVKVDAYVRSEDGMYTRWFGSDCTEEERAALIKAVQDYEKTAHSVILTRLLNTGVLKALSYTASEDAADEEKELVHNVQLIDEYMDNGYRNAKYYLCKPKTEQDIRDLITYSKLRYGYCSFEDNKELAAGKGYVFYVNTENEYIQLIDVKAMKDTVAKMCDFFSKKLK